MLWEVDGKFGLSEEKEEGGVSDHRTNSLEHPVKYTAMTPSLRLTPGGVLPRETSHFIVTEQRQQTGNHILVYTKEIVGSTPHERTVSAHKPSGGSEGNHRGSSRWAPAALRVVLRPREPPP